MQRTYFKREIINAPGFQSDNDEVLTFKGSTEDKSRGADNLAFVPEKIDNLSKKALFCGLELIYDPKTNLFYIDSDNIGTSFKGLEEYVESIQIVTQFTKAYGRESGLYKLMDPGGTGMRADATLDLLPDGSVYQIIVTSHSSALAQALYYRIRKGTISPVHSFSSEAGSSNANKQAEAEIARLQSGIAQYQNAMKGLRENFDIIKLQCDQAITECAQAVTECNKAKAEAKASENKANAYEKKLVEIAHYIEWVKDYLRRTIVAVEGSSTWGLKDKVLIHLRKIEKADIHEYLDGPDSQDDAA